MRFILSRFDPKTKPFPISADPNRIPLDGKRLFNRKMLRSLRALIPSLGEGARRPIPGLAYTPITSKADLKAYQDEHGMVKSDRHGKYRQLAATV